MTPRQLEILQHALGVDKYGQGDMYRNHFCAGGDDEAVCNCGAPKCRGTMYSREETRKRKAAAKKVPRKAVDKRPRRKTGAGKHQ